MRDDFERQMAERKRWQERTEGPWRELCERFLGLSARSRTFRRLEQARWAYREYRDAHQQDREMGGYELHLAVRVVADELARQIQEAAADRLLDPATIAWVLAGMRCPSQPFCTGCSACFTITAPNRPIPGQTGSSA